MTVAVASITTTPGSARGDGDGDAAVQEDAVAVTPRAAVPALANRSECPFSTNPRIWRVGPRGSPTAAFRRDGRSGPSDFRAMVEQLAAWYDAHRVDLKERAIDVRLERSPNDGRTKASAWLTMRRGPAESEIVVWDSGECELWGPVREEVIAGGDPQAEHRQLDTYADLSAALARVVSLFD